MVEPYKIMTIKSKQIIFHVNIHPCNTFVVLNFDSEVSYKIKNLSFLYESLLFVCQILNKFALIESFCSLCQDYDTFHIEQDTKAFRLHPRFMSAQA